MANIVDNGAIQKTKARISVILFSIILILLYGVNGYSSPPRAEQGEERVFDSAGKIIDADRCFKEGGTKKIYNNMLLFEIIDDNKINYLCRMDDDGKNLKLVFKYDMKHHNLPDDYDKYDKINYNVWEVKYIYPHWTTNGKIVFALVTFRDKNPSPRIPRQEGEYSRETREGKYYMAESDGSNLREISGELYHKYREDYHLEDDVQYRDRRVIDY